MVSSFFGQNQTATNANELSMESGGRVTISRNFSATGAGKTLLHQNFDTKVVGRNSAAPLRGAYNVNKNSDSLPKSLFKNINDTDITSENSSVNFLVEEDAPLKPLQINNGTGNMRLMEDIKPYDHNARPKSPSAKNSGLFKRINCFKAQSSEENPLILLNSNQKQAPLQNQTNLSKPPLIENQTDEFKNSDQTNRQIEGLQNEQMSTYNISNFNSQNSNYLHNTHHLTDPKFNAKKQSRTHLQ
jgi:hypothetical protein